MNFLLQSKTFNEIKNIYFNKLNSVMILKSSMTVNTLRRIRISCWCFPSRSNSKDLRKDWASILVTVVFSTGPSIVSVRAEHVCVSMCVCHMLYVFTLPMPFIVMSCFYAFLPPLVSLLHTHTSLLPVSHYEIRNSCWEETPDTLCLTLAAAVEGCSWALHTKCPFIRPFRQTAAHSLSRLSRKY